MSAANPVLTPPNSSSQDAATLHFLELALASHGDWEANVRLAQAKGIGKSRARLRFPGSWIFPIFHQMEKVIRAAGFRSRRPA